MSNWVQQCVEGRRDATTPETDPQMLLLDLKKVTKVASQQIGRPAFQHGGLPQASIDRDLLPSHSYYVFDYHST